MNCEERRSRRVISSLVRPYNQVDSLQAEKSRQHGSDVEHVHVLSYHPATLLHNADDTRAIFGYQGATDSDCLWLSTHYLSARPCTRQNYNNPFSRLIWHHTDTGSIQTSGQQQRYVHSRWLLKLHLVILEVRRGSTTGPSSHDGCAVS